MKIILLCVGVLLFLFSFCDGRRGGGGRSGGFGGFGRSSSGRSGGFFSRSRSSSSRSSSSGGAWGSGSKGSYPKQQWTNGGRKTPGSSGTPIGGGGFVNPKATSYGSSFGSKNTYSYKSPGYGTNFGTSFPQGVGKYGGKGFSKKALGLGVGAGFLGGAALGAAGTVATMGVYHRYLQYRLLLGGLGYNNYYYNNYYYNNQCWGGCPFAAHCEWGFCECNRGFVKRWGQCTHDPDSLSPRGSDFEWNIDCRDNNDCFKIDTNMICDTNKTIQDGGKCECRQDQRWNVEKGECQLWLDVDCSSITYDSEPSSVVLEAVNKTLDNLGDKNVTEVDIDDPSKPDNATLSASPNVTLSNSLLSSIDAKKATPDELKEAFCRDIDSFSWEFGKPERRYASGGPGVGAGKLAGIVVAVLIISFICCCCCFCFICKGAKDKLGKMFKSDDKQETGVTFSSVQAPHGEPGYPPQYPGGDAGYQPQQYPGAYTNPDGPPAIPPTQPGYDNYPPTYTPNNPYPSSQPPYPPNNQAPYPNHQLPYPPN